MHIHDEPARLKDVCAVARLMTWRSIESLAEAIEAERNIKNVKECQRKVTGEVVYNALLAITSPKQVG